MGFSFITPEERENREKKYKEMRDFAYNFCHQQNNDGVHVWGDIGYHDGELCKLFGKKDGMSCPLYEFADKHNNNKVRDCLFASEKYPNDAIKIAYNIIIEFMENSPEWKEGNFGGMTLDELHDSYKYEDIFFDEGPGEIKTEEPVPPRRRYGNYGW